MENEKNLRNKKENYNKMLNEMKKLKSEYNKNSQNNNTNTNQSNINSQDNTPNTYSDYSDYDQEKLLKFKEQNKKLDQKYLEIKKTHNIDVAESEAERHISNLRDIAEYNRWSLKLIQKWLLSFYRGKQNNLFYTILYTYFR